MAIICPSFVLTNIKAMKTQVLELQDSHYLRWFIILNLQIYSNFIAKVVKNIKELYGVRNDFKEDE